MTDTSTAFRDEADDAGADASRDLIGGISREQWNYWHGHPVTRLLLRYLRDYAGTLEKTALARWRENSLELSTEHQIRNRIIQIGEIEALGFDDVKRFYEEPPAA